VKFRSENTISERQLVLALAATGRKVALADLTVWRHDGLLPPLASIGSHNGRAYYWREPDILEQAEIAFDELRRHGRSDEAMIALYLGGFEVPLPRLRRAWQHGHRIAKAATIQPGAPVATRPSHDLSGLLQQATSAAAAALQPDGASRTGLAMLEHIAARLGIQRSNVSELHQAWHAAQITLSLLSTSSLMRQASDDALQRARRAQRIAMDFVWQSGAAESRAAAVAALGKPVFLYILMLLVSDRDTQLDAVLAMIAHRRKPMLQAQTLYAQA
jgi:hypothetical protein